MTVSFWITWDLITNWIPWTQRQWNDWVNPVLSSLMIETASLSCDALTMRIDFLSNTAAPDIAMELLNERNRICVWSIHCMINLWIAFTQDDFWKLFFLSESIWRKYEDELYNPSGRSEIILQPDDIVIGKEKGLIDDSVDHETVRSVNLGNILTPLWCTYFSELREIIENGNTRKGIENMEK